MGFDLVAFDPARAPSERDALVDWLKEEADDTPASSGLGAWAEAMHASFPEGDQHPAGHYAQYSARGPLVAMTCSYAIAQSAETRARILAVQHGVGIWIASRPGHAIWMPTTTALPQSSRRGLSLSVDELDTIVDPSDAVVYAALEWLDPHTGPGFAVLENSHGDYVQAFRGHAGFTVERRIWRRILKIRRGFRHEVAATAPDTDGPFVSLEGYEKRSQRVLANEVLSAENAVLMFRAFLESTPTPAELAWHDITAQLSG